MALAEPNGWDERRSGIQGARDRLESQLSHLKAPQNRRGDFRSYQSGFSFGMGLTVSSSDHMVSVPDLSDKLKLPMNFVNTAAVEEALAEFFADSDVQALFHYVEGAFLRPSGKMLLKLQVLYVHGSLSITNASRTPSKPSGNFIQN